MRVKLAYRLVLLAGSIGAACSLFDDPPRDRYALEKLDGEPVPMILISQRTHGGSLYELRMRSGMISFYHNGDFAYEGVSEVRLDSVLMTFDRVLNTGTYERTDTALIAHFRDSEGIDRVFTYRMAMAGQVLTGMQWNHFAEYGRR